MAIEQKGTTVFVVDDDGIFHFLMKRMLINLGLAATSIETASSGKEALDFIVSCQLTNKPFPNIILLDLNMPLMNGFEFIEAYKKLPVNNYPETRIIITSSSLNNHDVERALLLGATRYLTKPVSERELMEVLSELNTKD